MSVQPGPTEKRYAANGVSTIYAVPFLVIEAGDLKVYLDGVLLTSGYAHTGIGQPASTITFTIAPVGDLYLNLDVPFQRLVDYQENGDFLSTTVNRDFDRIWQALKQLFRFSTRTPMLGVNDIDGLGSYLAKGNRLSNLGDPTEAQDAVTRNWVGAYIDSVSGLINTVTGIAYDGVTLFDYLRFGVNRSVDTIAALRALSGARNQRAFVLGYYAKGDGGGGEYYIDPSDTTSADNSGTIIVAADGARWKLVSQIVSAEQFGAKSDNVTDDTAAIQKWVEYTGRLGGGTLKLTQGNTYYVPGTVIMPNWVSLDLNGCTIRGNRGGGSTASMFKTGYFNGSNVLVTNVGAAVDITIVDGVRITNGRILEAYRALEFTNANRTCGVEDMTFTGCVQSWLFFRCWSMKLKNCFTDTNSVFATPSYKWSQAINAIVCDQVRAVTDFAFEFSGGITGSGSIVFINCDVEGSANRAFYFQGQFYGVHWVGGYFEGIPGCVYDFADVTQITATWTGTFNYLSGVLIREPTSLTATLDGEWDTSNAIVGVTVGLPYPTQLNVSHPKNNIKFRLANNFASTTTLPANVITSGSGQADVECISTRWGTGSGDVISKAICAAGVIPRYYSGDAGRTVANQVAFSTHAAFNPGSSTIVILVTTKIVWRPGALFAKYQFTVTDSGGTWNLYGDVYGAFAKSQDGTAGKTIAAVNSGGFLRLELYGFTHPTGVYTCTGTVQMV